ncbi:NACHT domain-containing protein [Neorhizobium sp. DAR64860/K0K1]|uniref:NACHT domain-containing protein n=1 Tax=Neorhizobium sp. DAR64860/K0K1 TaxID=3421955 RepID=UPI003D2917A4
MAVGEGIILGVISSIVYDGLKRPFKGMADLLSRRRQITRALQTGGGVEPPEPRDDNQATSDLIRIIANEYGQYTENVARFLTEVERSVVPDALKQFILCGKEPVDAFPAFDLIYKAHAPLHFESQTLFDALTAAVRARIEQAIDEKMLFEAIKAQNGDLAARIDGLAASLRSAAAINDLLSSEAISEIRLKIARGVEQSNRQVNVETTQGTRKVNVKKLVIPARLKPLGSKDKIPAPHRDSVGEKQTTVGYLPFRRSFDRAVILGDPGGGKSTLTQLLCYDLANQIVLQAANPQASGFDSRDQKLPIRVILRALEKRQRQDPSYQIFDYLVDEIRVYCDNDSQLATAFLRQTLTLGQVVILFDGLDEILDVGSRRTMTVLIEQFSNAYASCPSLVTSRIVGYADAPLTEDYQIFTLSRFNKDEVRKFSEFLIRAVTGTKVQEAKVKADLFISQTENAAGDLRENPLLLGLMVYIFNVRGDVPNNRPEIYKECSLLMFEKWDQRRDILFELPTDFDMLDLFGFLASEIFGEAETEDGVSEEWLVQRLRTFFNSWYEDKARSVAAARILVDFITGRAWVMCEVGPGVFKFTHRTFLEYFFARRLEEEAGSVTALIQNHLLAKISQAQWDVVSHLALQIATFRSGPKSIQAIDALSRSAGEMKLAPNEEVNFLNFWAKSLEYLTMPEARLREAIEHIFHRIVHLGAVYSLDAADILHELIEACERRQEYVQKLINSVSMPILSGPANAERDFLNYLLGIRFSGYRTRRGSSYVFQHIWRTLEQSRSSVRSDQWSRACEDIHEARIYIYVYREKIVELYRLYGVQLIFTPYSALIPVEIYRLPFYLLSEGLRVASGRVGPRFSDLQLSRGDADAIITLLSDDLLQMQGDGTVDTAIFSGNEEMRRVFASEMMRYLEHVLRRSRLRQAETVSRCFYIFMLMFWQENKGDWHDRDGARRGSSVSQRLADMISMVRDDKFLEAARGILGIAESRA